MGSVASIKSWCSGFATDAFQSQFTSVLLAGGDVRPGKRPAGRYCPTEHSGQPVGGRGCDVRNLGWLQRRHERHSCKPGGSPGRINHGDGKHPVLFDRYLYGVAGGSGRQLPDGLAVGRDPRFTRWIRQQAVYFGTEQLRQAIQDTGALFCLCPGVDDGRFVGPCFGFRPETPPFPSAAAGETVYEP